ILRRRRVGRAAGECCERPHVANVVAARLLVEPAHGHVFDHARPQRADRPVGRMGSHRGILSRTEGCWTFDARDQIPRSSHPSVHSFPPAAKNAPTPTRPPPAKAGSFHAPYLPFAMPVGIGSNG